MLRSFPERSSGRPSLLKLRRARVAPSRSRQGGETGRHGCGASVSVHSFIERICADEFFAGYRADRAAVMCLGWAMFLDRSVLLPLLFVVGLGLSIALFTRQVALTPLFTKRRPHV
jgi:hypothetical protein